MKRQICITLEMDSKHDERAIRRLLKALLRIYRLKCVDLSEPKTKE
jgi:hypothetical protein